MNIETNNIMDELKSIKKTLNLIRKEMPDKDMFLTSEESRLLKESFEPDDIVSADDLLKELK